MTTIFSYNVESVLAQRWNGSVGTFEGAPIWNEELVNGDKEVQWSSHSGSNTNRCRSPALRRAPHPHGKVTRTKGSSSPPTSTHQTLPPLSSMVCLRTIVN